MQSHWTWSHIVWATVRLLLSETYKHWDGCINRQEELRNNGLHPDFPQMEGSLHNRTSLHPPKTMGLKEMNVTSIRHTFYTQSTHSILECSAHSILSNSIFSAVPILQYIHFLEYPLTLKGESERTQGAAVEKRIIFSSHNSSCPSFTLNIGKDRRHSQEEVNSCFFFR